MEQEAQQYYMVIDEQQAGPFTFEEIVMNPRLTPETLVWKPGYDNWIAAKNMPELAAAFMNANRAQSGQNVPPEFHNRQDGFNNFQGYGNGQDNRFANNPQYNPNHSYNNQNRYADHQHSQYNRYDPYHNQNRGYQRVHTNWLPWAIVATVLGFFTSCIGIIFGIIGIVQANKANNFYAQGFDQEGDSANSNARTMTIIGFVFAGIGIVASIFFGSIFSSILSSYGDYNWY